MARATVSAANRSRRRSQQPVARRDIHVDAVYDLETYRWSTFVLGGIRYSDGYYAVFSWHEEEAMVSALLDMEPIEGRSTVDIWAHNGGRFDHLWLLDHLLARGLEAEVISAGGRVICIACGHFRFYDSNALAKLTLKEFTAGLSVQKQSLGFACERESCPVCIAFGALCPKHERCDEECEGYCEISREMERGAWSRLLEYLRADCESLYAALQRLREYAAENDLDLGMTVGSAAWANVKRTLGLGGREEILGPSDHRFVRVAYFGGRVFVGRHHAPRVRECDVNAMYPSRLAEFPVPVGEPIRRYGRDARRLYNEGKPGAYRVKVTVPESFIPPLPYRLKDRIAYPTGTFSGTWCEPELRYAETCGVRIEEVYECVVWPTQKILFTDWVNRLFELRANAPGGKSGAMGTFIKFYQNSPTGKMGAKPHHSQLYINPEDIEECPGHGTFNGPLGRVSCTEDDCSGYCGAFRPFADGTRPIYEKLTWRLESYSRPEWSMYLTAQARIEWHRQAVSVSSGEDVCYGDTDGMMTLNERTRRIGKKVGEWMDKGWKLNFHVLAPKIYTYDLEEPDKDGKTIVVKAKGLKLPKDSQKARDAILSGKPLGKERPLGFRRAARTGKFFQRGTIQRVAGRGSGDRLPDADVTRPPRIEELPAP